MKKNFHRMRGEIFITLPAPRPGRAGDRHAACGGSR